MDTDRGLTWNGSATPGVWQSGDAALSFEGGDDVAGCAYLIVRKNAVFDAEMRVNGENLKALKDHPTITVSCLFDFLKQQVPGHTYANSPIQVSLIVDGEAQAPGDLNSVIPISTGYGIAGAGSGAEVTVPASALAGLDDGTYLVILLGLGGDGTVVALDQKEVVIGSGSGGSGSGDSSYYESDNTDWGGMDIAKTRKVLTGKDSNGAASVNVNPNIAKIEGLSGDGATVLRVRQIQHRQLAMHRSGI
jgi:hypothetical protein